MRNFIAFILLMIVLASCDPNAAVSDIRDPLQGSWTCKELQGQSYQVTVSNAPFEDDKMYFYNLYNLKQNVEVIISGSFLSIPAQKVSNFDLSGSGNVSSDKKKITLTFTADDENVQATMTKNQ